MGIREHSIDPAAAKPATSVGFRRRWLSGRAMLLHLTVVVVAPGCALAGWWQATRALAGNELSWAYSVEWPLFSLIAIAAWWHLIHEDPEAYRARKVQRDDASDPATEGAAGAGAAAEGGRRVALSRSLVHHAARLAIGTAVEFALGLLAVLLVPFGRPQGWIPASGEVAYLAHAIFGAFLLLGTLVFVVRVRRYPRLVRAAGWTGLAGVALAGAGGILTVDRSLIRFLGISVMFVGTAVAAFGYLIPLLLRSGEGESHGVPVPAGDLAD